MNDLVETLGGPTSLYILAAGYFGMVFAERLFHIFREDSRYDDRDMWCSIGLNLISSVIGIIVSIILPIALYVWVFDSYRVGTIETLWLSLPVAFIVHELSYYWEHRAAHRIGLLWAFHSVHHSSNSFNHSTAARNFYFDGQLKAVGALFAAFLGVPIVVYIAVTVIKNLYGIWNHASYVGHLGPLEHIFATPLNHKIHHAREPEYIDKNYSQVLIVWDRLFGSLARYGQEPTVGLVERIHNNNPLTAQFVGFKSLWRRIASADNFYDKISYLFRPPEWSHITDESGPNCLPTDTPLQANSSAKTNV